MIHPLFTGFVAFVMQELPDYALENFQNSMLKRLTAFQESETPQLLDWYEDLESYWREHLTDEVIDEDLEAFNVLLSAIDIEELMQLSLIIRRDLSAEDLPDLVNTVKAFSATYTLEWEDGRRLEYNCKPISLQEKLRFETPMLLDLALVFDRQIAETLISPGPDTLYEQAARPYDVAKYDELMNVLQNYIAQKPGGDRDPYIDVLARVMHQFGPAPKLELIVESEDDTIEWLDNGGGF